MSNHLPEDITANRHKNSPTSSAANERVEPIKSVMRNQIVDWARNRENFTMKEVCRAFNKFPNEVSGRLSELKAQKIIVETGLVRDRCAVLKVDA